jgi:hypothetical protein
MDSRSYLPFALYILSAFATLLIEVPIVRLTEQALCNRHFRTIGTSGIEEAACKIPEIQDLLAKIVGWKMSFDALPGKSWDTMNNLHY